MPPIRRSKSITTPEKRLHEINHEPCPVCGLVVRYKCDIARHQRQHAENKEDLMTHCPWPECEYKSLQRSNVTVHARKHHNWQIHHCRPTCKFSAVLKKDLAQHQQEIHRTKCTITEWEEEGPIDPDRAPCKPYKQKQKSRDASPSSISEERGVTNLDPSFTGARDAAYRYGAYEPRYELNTSNFPAWLLWNQLQMFERLAQAFPMLPPNPLFLRGQQQQHPAQRQQPQLSWNPNTTPTQERGNSLFSFENPSPPPITPQQIRQQLQMWNHAFKDPLPTAHYPSTISGSVPSGTVASSSMPAQLLQQPKARDPEIEEVLNSRFPLTYKAYKELQAQQQQPPQQKLTRNPVMENTAVPEASAALKTTASDMSAELDTLTDFDDVNAPVGFIE